MNVRHICLLGALGFGLLPGVLPAQRQQGQSRSQSLSVLRSPAALTSFVFLPSLALDLFTTNAQRRAAVTYGGDVHWILRGPVVGSVSLFRAMDAGGQTLRSSYEIGGSWRLRDELFWGDRAILVDGSVRRGAGVDTITSTYFVGQTVLRRFTGARFGLMNSHIYESGGQPSNTGTAIYVGISRNELANDHRGAMGLKYLKTAALDLLIGGADSTALGDGKGRFGYRGLWRSGFGLGSALTSRIELGSRPAQGFFFAWTIDYTVMLLDLGRF